MASTFNSQVKIDTKKLGTLGQIAGSQLERFASEALAPLKFEAALALEESLQIKRSPWILTCVSWIPKNDYIIMNPNPKDISWDFPLRSTLTKTASGAVTFVWRDPSRQNSLLDEPILNITMQSSSLLPKMTMEGRRKENAEAIAKRVAPESPFKDVVANKIKEKVSTGENYKAPPGIEIFYKFLELYNVPRISNSTGEQNHIRIIMSTVLFPRLVVRGMFVPEEQLTWTESSTDNPTSIEWKIKLIINKITPDIGISNFEMMLGEWKRAGGGLGFKSIPEEFTEKGTVKNLRDTYEAERNKIEEHQKTSDVSLVNRLNALKSKHGSLTDEVEDKVRQDEIERETEAKNALRIFKEDRYKDMRAQEINILIEAIKNGTEEDKEELNKLYDEKPDILSKLKEKYAE